MKNRANRIGGAVGVFVGKRFASFKRWALARWAAADARRLAVLRTFLEPLESRKGS
jgi:hypothetical protein